MEQAELDYEVREHKREQREALVYRVLRATLAAMAERGLRYLSLVATIGLFSWAMWEPEVLRTITASLFAVVFVIVLHRKGSGDGN